MAGFGHGLPGDRYTRLRLAELLTRGNANNGTTLGGLAHIGNQLLAGYLMREGLTR